MNKIITLFCKLIAVICVIIVTQSCESNSDSPTKVVESKIASGPYSALPYGRDFWKYATMSKDSVVSIFSTASPEDLSWFWKEKLQSEIKSGRFNAQEQAFISKGIELASPDFFIPSNDSTKRIINQSFIKEAKSIFNAAAAYAIFATHRVYSKETSAFDSLTQTDLEKRVPYKGDVYLNCNCNTVSDWCISDTECEGICNLSTGYGCGTFMAFHCQGSCK